MGKAVLQSNTKKKEGISQISEKSRSGFCRRGERAERGPDVLLLEAFVKRPGRIMS